MLHGLYSGCPVVVLLHRESVHIGFYVNVCRGEAADRSDTDSGAPGTDGSSPEGGREWGGLGQYRTLHGVPPAAQVTGHSVLPGTNRCKY